MMDDEMIFTEDLIVQDPIFISGVGRSGTTILGKLIATLKDIEYEYEPLMVQRILLLERLGHLDPPITEKLLKNYLDELIYNKLVGRDINLKPTDDSLFLKTNTWENIFQRWNRKEDRKDIKNLVEKEKIKLAIKHINFSLFYDRVLEMFKDSKLIIIYRYGFDVMDSLNRRRWLNDPNLNDKNMVMPRKEADNGSLVPWWVEEEKLNDFASWNLHTRSLYMWRYLNEIGLKKLDDLPDGYKKDVLQIKFEDLVEEPNKITENISEFIGTEPSHKTAEIIDTIDPRIARFKKPPEDKIVEEELRSAERLNERLGY